MQSLRQQTLSAFGGSLLCAFVFVWGRVEMSERAAKPCCTPLSEKGAQLQVAEWRRAGASMHRMGAGNEVDSEAQNFWRAPKVAEMLR